MLISFFLKKMQKKYQYTKNKFKNKDLKNKQTISFFSLHSLEVIYIKKFHFESIRRLFARKVKKNLNFIIYKNSNRLPVFNKPLKVRMGSGRGSFEEWIWKFQKFQKIFEISFFKKYYLIKKYLVKLKKKIPCKIFLKKK